MKNGEKYKTADERAKAFDEYCYTHRGECDGCSVSAECHLNNATAVLYWLDLEAEDEKPLPCPYCGSECFVKAIPSKAWVWCSDDSCGYVSGACDSEEEAVAAHNFVRRLVDKEKGGEARNG